MKSNTTSADKHLHFRQAQLSTNKYCPLLYHSIFAPHVTILCDNRYVSHQIKGIVCIVYVSNLFITQIDVIIVFSD